mmetsp:Transcript_14475/g.35067  ORF Transcript_14475/g.35067 Transcript_14475/m.35067 type:complete len:335 (+) Transcript_14475:126-1130(+)
MPRPSGVTPTALRLPPLSSANVKATCIPGSRPVCCTVGLSRSCTKMSPGMESLSRNPHPLSKRLTMPTSSPGPAPAAGCPRGVLERSRSRPAGGAGCHGAGTEGTGTGPPTRCTFDASGRPFLSAEMVKSTDSPVTSCCPLRCGFPISPTNRSPLKTGEMMKPWEFEKLRTVPEAVCPIKSIGSFLTTVMLVACLFPLLLTDSAKVTVVPATIPCAWGLSRRWKKQSPSNASEVRKPQSPLKERTTPEIAPSAINKFPGFGRGAAAGSAKSSLAETTFTAFGLLPEASTVKVTGIPLIGRDVNDGLSRRWKNRSDVNWSDTRNPQLSRKLLTLP